jgi:hypothetical protein
LQVVSSNGSDTENGINGFGLQATAVAGPSARVYGQSRMEAFIVISNTSVFYLAQIEAAHAGKTLEIKLFDPGDITSTNFKIRLPTSTGFVYPNVHVHINRKLVRGTDERWADDDAYDIEQLVQLLQQPVGDDLRSDSGELHGADAAR